MKQKVGPLRRAGVVAGGLFVGVLTILRLSVPGAGASLAAPNVRIVAADATGFTVDLRLPPATVEVTTRDGRPCGVPRLAAVPDGPAPAQGDLTYGWLVGVPEAGGAVVRAEVLEEEPWQAPPLPCGPARSAPADRVIIGRALADVRSGGADPASVAVTAWPARRLPVAALDPVGDLRGQRLARLVVRPIARAVAGGLVYRTRIRIRVDYRHPASITAAPSEPGPFDLVREPLLNRRFLPHRIAVRAGGLPGDVTRAPNQVDPPWTAPADSRALKIVVDRDGPVVVTGVDLARAGWDLATIDSARLALMVDGGPAAYHLTGVADGRLAPASRLAFQGRAMTGLYTRENVYWLVPDGQPVYMGARSVEPGSGSPARAFSETLRYEQDTRWFASMNPRDGDDRWMWGDALNAADKTRRAVTVTLPVANLAPDPAAGRLRIRIQGFTDDPRVSPDHHVRVLLNDRLLGSWRFDGMGIHERDFGIPEGGLVVGDNRLSLQAVGDSGALVDQFYLNRVALDVAAGYRATADRLDFAAPTAGAGEFALTGFSTPDVTVQDVTEPDRPVRLTGGAVAAAGDGTYTVRLRDKLPAGRRHVAFAPAAARPPARIAKNVASDWRSAEIGADYIVITHPDFAAALQPLVERRRQQGLRIAVVPIDDLYDEFAYGVFDPRAIRTFLRHAYRTWAAPAPTYVLLVGEANLDYRRGYNSGPPNFVPSVTLDEHHGSGELTAYMSDQWFAMMGDDPVPDLLLGRFSVSTADQARTVVAKTLRYEDQPLDAPWRRRAVLVTDDTDAALMERLSEDLVGHMPADTDVRRFYAARYPVTRSLSTDIGAAVDQGAMLLNFAGHANVALWSPWPGGGHIFDNAAIGRLGNGDAMPLFTAATCMNGWVDHPLKPVSMAELWLTHPRGGGAVAWAPSGFSTLSAQAAMFPLLVDGLYDGRVRPIGALVAAAGATVLGQSMGYEDAVNMYVLLGDPALVVSGVPPRPTATPPPPGVYLPLSERRVR